VTVGVELMHMTEQLLVVDADAEGEAADGAAVDAGHARGGLTHVFTPWLKSTGSLQGAGLISIIRLPRYDLPAAWPQLKLGSG
jgi:hypothetical protein